MGSLTMLQWLKLYLLAHGIKITDQAKEAWQKKYQGPLSLSEYASTSGICLAFEGEVYVNAPFKEYFTHKTRATLMHKNGFGVFFRNTWFPCRVIPVPSYHHLSYVEEEKSIPYTDMGVTHTDRCRISPIGGCAWRCGFCDMGYQTPYHKKSPQGMLESIIVASSDQLTPANHVLISGGTPEPQDELWLDNIYAFIAEKSPIPVDIMLAPRKDKHYPNWLRSIGINSLSVNLEIWNGSLAKTITPQKHLRAGRKDYLHFMESSVKSFGVGKVQSLLIVGLEPLRSTLEGVHALVSRGCIPVLSPFRPAPGTPLESARPANFKEMREAYLETMEICQRLGGNILPGPRCIPCQHNTITFPTETESDFYVKK